MMTSSSPSSSTTSTSPSPSPSSVARLAAFLAFAPPLWASAAFVAPGGVGGGCGIGIGAALARRPPSSSSRSSAAKREEEDGGGGIIGRNDDDRMPLYSRRMLSPSLDDPAQKSQLERGVATLCTTLGFSALFLANPLLPHLPYSTYFSSAHAEDELYAKYGGKGLDASLVDKDCLVNKCAAQARACLRDDPDCRKGLACTAKCLGDNSCITGCFARYGNSNLDGLLKCTIEDNDCIKVAILEGGADARGDEPRSPAPTVRNFDLGSMEGTWYKVAGYNPNYDCYACQRNTFSAPGGGWADAFNGRMSESPYANARVPTDGLVGAALSRMGADRLQIDVEFSMPMMNLELDDGGPPPPSGVREKLDSESGLQSVGYNAYSTHETMVFDDAGGGGGAVGDAMKLGKGGDEKLYSRTAHSEGEMFGLSECRMLERRSPLFSLALAVHCCAPTPPPIRGSHIDSYHRFPPLSLSSFSTQNSGRTGTSSARTTPTRTSSSSYTTTARRARTRTTGRSCTAAPAPSAPRAWRRCTG